ncbi:MAG: DUF935 family protein [Thermoguttaceae bacterium]
MAQNIIDLADRLPAQGRNARDRSQVIPGMPPGGAQWLTPHAITFQGIFSSVSRVYRMSDEALKASLDQARYMLNDPVITEPLYYRLRCLALLDWHLEPEDKKNPTENWLCQQCTAIIKRTPRFTQYRKALARAVWFGRYGVQHQWGWREVLGERRLCIVDQKPVHGDKLVFRYDDGSGRFDPKQVGIRVGAGFSEGAKMANRWRIDDLRKIEPTDRGLAYFLDPWEKDLLLAVHKAEIEDGEYEDPQSAGKICGTGLRSMVYWTWYQKQELMVELLTYLDRSATGIEIMFYPMGNKTAQIEARDALEKRIGENGNGLLIPRPEDNPGSYGYDRIEPGMAGAGIIKEIIVDLFNHQIKRSIVGQVLTTESDATGLGSNLADVHKDTFLGIIKEDATNEEETLTTDTLMPVLKCNFPKYQSANLRLKIDTETEDTEARINALLECAQAGLPIKRQSLYDTLGEAKPEDTDETIGGQPQGAGPQAMMPGMPPAGEPGGQPPKRAMVQGGLDVGGDDVPTEEEQQAAMAQALELQNSMEGAQPSENSDRRIVKP